MPYCTFLAFTLVNMAKINPMQNKIVSELGDKYIFHSNLWKRSFLALPKEKDENKQSVH